MITPGTAVVMANTRTGRMNEWSNNFVPSFVVPVSSKFAAAICDPFVGRVNTPAKPPAHMALTAAGESPTARPIGTIVRVAVDWLVVSAATRNTPMRNTAGQLLTMGNS